MAANLRREQQNFFYDSYEEECVAAAYELIEQSATLRKEWFGK